MWIDEMASEVVSDGERKKWKATYGGCVVPLARR